MSEASYLDQVANLQEWILDRGQTHAETAALYARQLLNAVSDYDELRAKAKEVLDPEWVDGDSHGVPCELTIVNELVEEIKRLRAAHPTS